MLDPMTTRCRSDQTEDLESKGPQWLDMFDYLGRLLDGNCTGHDELGLLVASVAHLGVPGVEVNLCFILTATLPHPRPSHSLQSTVLPHTNCTWIRAHGGCSAHLH